MEWDWGKIELKIDENEKIFPLYFLDEIVSKIFCFDDETQVQPDSPKILISIIHFNSLLVNLIDV